MKLKIDYREAALIELIKEMAREIHPMITVEICNLPIGDIIISDDNNIEQIIIERKTLNDLAASILDGRYKEQCLRLQNCNLHNHAIYYLIEGNIHTYKPHTSKTISKQSLISAMMSMSYSNGFSIYRSGDIQESVLWLLQATDKLSKIMNNYYYVDNITTNNIDDSTAYVAVSKRIKKNNITMDNIGSIMLSQIPSVSAPMAVAIMDKYKTIDNLILDIRVDKQALNLLTTITKNGKPRKLSKPGITNIYNFLLCKEE